MRQNIVRPQEKEGRSLEIETPGFSEDPGKWPSNLTKPEKQRLVVVTAYPVEKNKYDDRTVYLEVTYRETGDPWVAYLYLSERERKRKREQHMPVKSSLDMVLDINKQGKLIGIELLSPEMVTIDAVNPYPRGIRPGAPQRIRPRLPSWPPDPPTFLTATLD